MSCGKKTSALDHLPSESVAGTAVFCPMSCVGSAVRCPEEYPSMTRSQHGGRLQCHPMVHTGRHKHPALHIRYHLPGQLNMAPGAGKIVTLPATVIQADLYRGAWVRLRGSMLPADFIQLMNSIDYPQSARCPVARKPQP